MTTTKTAIWPLELQSMSGDAKFFCATVMNSQRSTTEPSLASVSPSSNTLRKQQALFTEYVHAQTVFFVCFCFAEDFTPILTKTTEANRTEQEMPPYNGFGNAADSLCSCSGLLPKPPKRDFLKFMESDRQGLESNVLRFLAKFDTTHPVDSERRFIISFYLSDDSIIVFEPPVRNSGTLRQAVPSYVCFSGGNWLENNNIFKLTVRLCR